MNVVDPGLLIALVVLLAILVLTAYTELAYNRIPNWITVPGLLLGLAIGYLPGGITLKASLIGFLVGFLFLFFFYMYGGIGGGDVKLMGAVGALQGYPVVLDTLFYTAIYGGLMSVMVLIWKQNLRHAVWHSLCMFFRRRAPEDVSEDEQHEKLGAIPYGLAIIGGAVSTAILYAP